MTSSTLKEYLHPLDEIIERALDLSHRHPLKALDTLRHEWMNWRAEAMRAQKIIRGDKG